MLEEDELTRKDEEDANELDAGEGPHELSLPRILTELSADLLVAALCRVPFASHGAVRATCSRARDAVGSAAFARERRDGGWAERAVVVSRRAWRGRKEKKKTHI